MKLNVAKAPGCVRSIAAVKFDPAGEGKFRDYKLGSFGAAPEVKRIDPAANLAETARGEHCCRSSKNCQKMCSSA